MGKNFDFGGWATKANLLCSDGRIIRNNAFEESDGKTVPLVWNHMHNDPDAVLGHALLENRGDGVYAYCTFNDTDAGQNAKLLVRHGDVNQLSIYANKLKQNGRDVIHGIIREVSLVLAGANEGATIDSVVMHSDDSYEEGIIYTGESLEDVEPLYHSDNNKKGESDMATDESKKPNKDDKTIKEVFDTLTDEQKDAVYVMLGQILEENGIKPTEKQDDIKHSDDVKSDDKKQDKTKDTTADDNNSDDDETVEDVFNTLTEKQKKVVCAIIGQVTEDANSDDQEKDDQEKDDDKEGGNNSMKHNIFDSETKQEDVLTHSEMVEIMDEAKRNNRSLADTVLQHGIENVDYLMPEAQLATPTPEFIKRDDTWVAGVMDAVHKTPFSRIKSVFANITENDARAKGYIKGNMKAEELFSLLKRITTPTTVYKKQSLDRDDMVDITDFDVVAWLKQEMRGMLDEEIARAILVGDGRSASSADKINEQNIRPIWTDDDVYTVKAAVNITDSTTDDAKAKAFIKATIKSRKNYKGSGNPVMYIDEDILTLCLLMEDTQGRVIYDTVDKLATALRASKIVPVPVMDGLTRTVGANTHTLGGIYVNLNDYNLGADKGGAVSLFDDFDIDYNQQKYLIETRCSGALIKPYAAVAIEFVKTA